MREWLEDLADDLGYDLDELELGETEALMIQFALRLWLNGDRQSAESHAKAALKAAAGDERWRVDEST